MARQGTHSVRESNIKSQAPLLRLLNHFKHHRLRITKASLYTVANKIFDIMPEILIGIAIDVVVSKEKSFIASWGYSDPWHQILILAGLTFLIWAGESFFEYLFMINWRNLAQEIQHELRLDAFRNTLSMKMSTYEDSSSGELVSIINDDVNQLERFLDTGASQVISTLTAVVGVGCVFFYISPQIALFAFMPIPLVIIGAFYFQRKQEPLYKEVREQVGGLASKLSNTLMGLLSVKSYTAENHEVETLRGQSENYMRANKSAIAVSSAFIPVIRMAILAGFLVTFILGGYKVLKGELNVGSYGVLVFLTQRLLWPLTNMATLVDFYERAMASTRRILNLVDEVPEDHTSGFAPEKIQGQIEFKAVDFSYNQSQKILDTINLEIGVHSTTAFVGATGSGKSTLIKLLMGYYEASSGDIRIDGTAIADYNLTQLRSRISYVGQEVFLFDGTIYENIVYGSFGASKEAVEKAISLAEADQFIAETPNGLETLVGERGIKLSGGQRQRISLARAILKNPDLLILDEATSAVDNETEAAIQRSLDLVSKGRTTLVVAHRLSTIVNADKICVIDKGQLVQQGRHKDLISQEGVYRRLWNVQTGVRSS